MKTGKSCRWALASAVGTLLGTQAQANESQWQVESRVRYYSEDGRITSVEPVMQFKKTDELDRTISFNISYDSLSGASPNGAAISQDIQTFTSTSGAQASSNNSSVQTVTASSGRNISARDNDDDDDYEFDDDDDEQEYNTGQNTISQYHVNPGEVPLDPNFKDQRFAFSMNVSQPINRHIESSMGISYSQETDYLSLGINGGATYFMNQKNTQLGFYFGLEKDQITPFGGTPQGLSPTHSEVKAGDAENKWVIDGLISLTQTLSPNAIMQMNYAVTQSNGYHSDPYKIISLIDDSHSTQDYIFEHRPNQRTKQNLYAAFKLHIFGDTLDTSYRYMWDNWGVKSQTWDSKYRLNLGHFYIQPHYRVYRQSAADFFVNSLQSSQALPQYASADYRLGELTTSTLGAKINWQFSPSQALSVRLERYHQTGESDAAQMSATISQMSYKWSF